MSYLKNSAADWVNGVEPDDDVTFVVIKVKMTPLRRRRNDVTLIVIKVRLGFLSI